MNAASVGAVTLYDLSHLHRIDPSDARARRQAWDELHLVTALQGIVNRSQPRLYVLFVGEDERGGTDQYWLEHLRQPGEWLNRVPIEKVGEVRELVQRYRRSFNGLVVWDERVPATALVASTAAGAENLLPVRYDPAPDSLYSRLTQGRGALPVRCALIRPDGRALFTGRDSLGPLALPSTGSAKCDALLWALGTFLRKGKCAPGILGYYPDGEWLSGRVKLPLDRTLLSNHDYFIARKGFFFDLSPWEDTPPVDDPQQPLGADARTLRAILMASHDLTGGAMTHIGGFVPWEMKYTDAVGEPHGAVESEWRFVEMASCFNAYLDADAPALGAMANASFFMHYPLQKHYPQRHPDQEMLQREGYVLSNGKVAPYRFVAFYVGDYDSSAWFYRMVPRLWSDPARGKVPLAWAFNPNLSHRFPVGMDYVRRNASPQDYFIAGNSGAGYLNPGYLSRPRPHSGLPDGWEAWEKHCQREYRRWDLRVTGFIIDGNARGLDERGLDAYARFSPGGIAAQKIPEQGIHRTMPYLRMRDDLPGEGGVQLTRALEVIGSRLTGQVPQFLLFRTILWTPSYHLGLKRAIEERFPGTKVVHVGTLFALLRQHLSARGG
ncbi:MAG: GxGYxYP family putative glycoside hydrolase [Armatimonadota bacterium]|nr:GxGYxYP family putative glycoside hydrolase [bacterium]MDW8289623.1 GxGYxYP family putative glycoside hydrolase [Armatimonadota bacterium]